MTWVFKESNQVSLGLQDRFTIIYDQLDFFSREFQRGLDNADCEKDSKDFAESLLAAIGDHLSRRNLRDLINECTKRLEEW